MDRVECRADPELDRSYPERWGAWARVTTADGRTLEAHIADPKGDPPNPFSPEELRHKFSELTAATHGEEHRAALIDAVERIGEGGVLKRLLDLLPGDPRD